MFNAYQVDFKTNINGCNPNSGCYYPPFERNHLLDSYCKLKVVVIAIVLAKSSKQIVHCGLIMHRLKLDWKICISGQAVKAVAYLQ